MALADYACNPAHSRGRIHKESPPVGRTEFQRDRDRIVHSTAFRRLVYKTQVFLNHEGDLFRTRLTHSLEVAQIGRSIARALGLNEDLVEAVALAHDLGHTPFGHAGQDALNACMRQYGGFEHNLQSLRVVDLLEERYPDFNGLNLCFETREGILKHCSLANAQRLEQIEPGGVGQRFIQRTQPSLEAQLCNLADEIAYNAHDVDDGVRSGLVSLEQLESVPVFGQLMRLVLNEHPQLQDGKQSRRLLYGTIRRMLSEQVDDVIKTAHEMLEKNRFKSLTETRRAKPLLAFSPSMQEKTSELKKFLMLNLYQHQQVLQTMEEARTVIQELFHVYSNAPEEMQTGFSARAVNASEQNDAWTSRYRVVADYIAGMTDRFASREYERVTGKKILS
jgi:dGTPase